MGEVKEGVEVGVEEVGSGEEEEIEDEEGEGEGEADVEVEVEVEEAETGGSSDIYQGGIKRVQASPRESSVGVKSKRGGRGAPLGRVTEGSRSSSKKGWAQASMGLIRKTGS